MKKLLIRLIFSEYERTQIDELMSICKNHYRNSPWHDSIDLEYKNAMDDFCDYIKHLVD